MKKPISNKENKEVIINDNWVLNVGLEDEAEKILE
jgi:hypothetical protein